MKPSVVGSRRVNLLAAWVLAAAVVLGALAAGAQAKGLTARGSVEQVQVTGAAPGAQLTLVDRHGKRA
ncbi:MAG: hypothetical protein QOJ21_3667, partial [Solirubrobacteraceae bacterium]|nr:hypothetical protein [Solirubrobacteraceae bacterium]